MTLIGSLTKMMVVFNMANINDQKKIAYEITYLLLKFQ